MNIHTPIGISRKFPQMEFRGKPFTCNGKTYIRAEFKDKNVYRQTFFYCIEDEFFYMDRPSNAQTHSFN